MTSDTEHLPTEKSEYLASNAEFFARAFAPLNKIFQNPGAMVIVSEEELHTVAVGLALKNEDGGIDADCALIKPGQGGLSDAIKSISI